MHSLAAGALAFVIITCAGLLGLRLTLHESYRGDESRDAVRFTQGVVASLSALVLSLLIAGATDHYRSQAAQLRGIASDVMVLDRTLLQYGPEAAPARQALREALEFNLRLMWSGKPRGDDDTPLVDAITTLHPTSPGQSFMQAKALDLVVTLTRSRASLITAEHAGDVQTPIVLMLIAWFALLFLAMGLFSRPNLMSVAATIAGAIAVSSALVLVLELDRPFAGMLAVSDAPLRDALKALMASTHSTNVTPPR
jgi:hypothetical protein